MATSTPWGQAQQSKKIATGIMQYYTASHGGIHLSPKRNAMVPDYMRMDNGWYEEDCEWAIPAMVFPEAFVAAYDDASIEVNAHNTLRNWFPSAYEKFLGKAIKEGESTIRDQEIFEERNKNNYVVVSASIDNTDNYGSVLGFATIGGQRHDYSQGKTFRIPTKEYDARSSNGFVINLEIHKEVS